MATVTFFQKIAEYNERFFVSRLGDRTSLNKALLVMFVSLLLWWGGLNLLFYVLIGEFILLIFPFGVISILAFWFITVFLCYSISKNAGAKLEFRDFLKEMGYATAPMSLGIIPYIGMFIGFLLFFGSAVMLTKKYSGKPIILTTTGNNVEDEKVKAKGFILGMSRILLSVILFIESIGCFLNFLGLGDLNPGGTHQQLFSGLLLLLSILFLASAIGFLYKQRFAYYLAWPLTLPLILNLDFSAGWQNLIGEIKSVLSLIVILIINRNHIKPVNKTDYKVAKIIGLALLAFIIFSIWTLQQP